MGRGGVVSDVGVVSSRGRRLSVDPVLLREAVAALRANDLAWLADVLRRNEEQARG